MPSSRVKFLMVFLVSAYKAAHKSELSDTADPKDAKKKKKLSGALPINSELS